MPLGIPAALQSVLNFRAAREKLDSKDTEVSWVIKDAEESLRTERVNMPFIVGDVDGNRIWWRKHEGTFTFVCVYPNDTAVPILSAARHVRGLFAQTFNLTRLYDLATTAYSLALEQRPK